MLETLKKHNRKVLVTVDEAVNTQEMRVFTSAFQILIRKDLPIFLLMTGLYENINDLQNVKSLTFLYRAPKIELKPLDMRLISDNYQNNLNISEEVAKNMAKLTKGYSFAFQILGYLTYEKGIFDTDVISQFKQYLNEYAYEKIWDELSGKDKEIAYGIAKCESGKIVEIRQFLKLETNQLNPYRRRLIRKGIVDGSRYGYLYFVLPMFNDFVINEYENDIDEYRDIY